MTKEELIKVFSVYLPYNLNIQLPSNDSYPNKITKLSGIMNFGLLFLGSGGRFGFTERDIDKVKPILYDLSFLTKEIEHEGVRINIQKQMRHLDFEWLIGNPKLASKLDQEDYEILLKHHFNIFNLPEDQFINKATLNK